jgi:hypothetical protein
MLPGGPRIKPHHTRSRSWGSDAGNLLDSHVGDLLDVGKSAGAGVVQTRFDRRAHLAYQSIMNPCDRLVARLAWHGPAS